MSTHRDAQDTVEGIAEWWLLEQRIRHVITQVKQALVELVAQGMVLERAGRDGRVRYRLNPRKRNKAAQYLQHITSTPTATASSDRVGTTEVKPIEQR